MTRLTIIGAGPAGLATAYELLQQDRLGDFEVDIYEMDRAVGGIAKTLRHNGYRFDLGGHRFYTKFPEIEAFYRTFLGSEMLTRPRLSRIYYEK
jgi:protoporphyrinogen oxidase